MHQPRGKEERNKEIMREQDRERGREAEHWAMNRSGEL